MKNKYAIWKLIKLKKDWWKGLKMIGINLISDLLVVNPGIIVEQKQTNRNSNHS